MAGKAKTGRGREALEMLDRLYSEYPHLFEKGYDGIYGAGPRRPGWGRGLMALLALTLSKLGGWRL